MESFGDLDLPHQILPDIAVQSITKRIAGYPELVRPERAVTGEMQLSVLEVPRDDILPPTGTVECADGTLRQEEDRLIVYSSRFFSR